jgi:hypothetical protein
MLLPPSKVFACLTIVSIALGATLVSSAPQSATKKSIRAVDFRNFTFPETEGLHIPHSRKRSFKLKDGSLPETRDKQGFVDEMGIDLSKVSYGDVTGDGQEEAIVVLSILTGGSAMPNCVYIYTWDQRRPKLLWAFDTGDRADGGLRRVNAENGYLLVELYGARKILGKDLGAEDKTNRGACCPTFFTRAFYKWTGNGFRLASKPKVLPNPIYGPPPQSRTD